MKEARSYTYNLGLKVFRWLSQHIPAVTLQLQDQTWSNFVPQKFLKLVKTPFKAPPRPFRCSHDDWRSLRSRLCKRGKKTSTRKTMSETKQMCFLMFFECHLIYCLLVFQCALTFLGFCSVSVFSFGGESPSLSRESSGSSVEAKNRGPLVQYLLPDMVCCPVWYVWYFKKQAPFSQFLKHFSELWAFMLCCSHRWIPMAMMRWRWDLDPWFVLRFKTGQFWDGRWPT